MVVDENEKNTLIHINEKHFNNRADQLPRLESYSSLDVFVHQMFATERFEVYFSFDRVESPPESRQRRIKPATLVVGAKLRLY